MVTRLLNTNSIAMEWLCELRNINNHSNKQEFRKNIEKVGEIIAYEISKTFEYEFNLIKTPLGVKEVYKIIDDVVIFGILRAGMPLFNGLLNILNKSECGFIASYRKHEDDGFYINQQYITMPNIDNKVVIIADTMLASGASFIEAIKEILKNGKPKKIHLVCVLSSLKGIETIVNNYPDIDIWMGDMDYELNSNGYIIPGLGDAGDICYGEKINI